MLKGVENYIGRLWQRNKSLLVFLAASIVFHIILLFVSIVNYSQLRKISGIVDELQVDRYKGKLFLKVGLVSDNNTYYQVYTSRFDDNNLSALKEGNTAAFYTTINKYKRRKAILSDDQSTAFEYYPILNINSQKSFFTVLLYNIYRHSLLSFLFNFSLVGTFFYSIPFIATTTWKKRFILLLIGMVYLWLWY